MLIALESLQAERRAGKDYMLYSNLIGKENVIRLKRIVEKEIIEEKAKYEEYWANNPDQL